MCHGYRSMHNEKVPNSKTKKSCIINWLTEKNIPTQTVPEFLWSVKEKKHYQAYEFDVFASLMGHEVIWLPPYCCQVNPIKSIWFKVKGEVVEKNKTFKMKKVYLLVNEAVSNVTIDDRKKCVSCRTFTGRGLCK